MKLQDKQVLLSGATGGMSWAIAERLAEAGAKLLLLGRNEVKLRQLQQALPGEHRILVADLNQPDGRAAIVGCCHEQGLDAWVNAAGVLDFQLFDEQDSAQVQNMLTTNLLSPILLAHTLLPLLQQRDEAVLVNIGSIFGSIGHPGFAAYCSSKFGLRGFTEALQRECHGRAQEASLRAAIEPLALESVAVHRQALAHLRGDRVGQLDFTARALLHLAEAFQHLGGQDVAADHGDI